jgi:hypothetical protein
VPVPFPSSRLHRWEARRGLLSFSHCCTGYISWTAIGCGRKTREWELEKLHSFHSVWKQSSKPNFPQLLLSFYDNCKKYKLQKWIFICFIPRLCTFHRISISTWRYREQFIQLTFTLLSAQTVYKLEHFWSFKSSTLNFFQVLCRHWVRCHSGRAGSCIEWLCPHKRRNLCVQSRRGLILCFSSPV